MVKITEHFKKRYAGRMIDFEDIEETLKETPTEQPDKRLKYVGEYLTVITDSKTEYLVTAYYHKRKKSKPLEKQKQGPKNPCAHPGCNRKAWKIGPYCGKHFKTINGNE